MPVLGVVLGVLRWNTSSIEGGFPLDGEIPIVIIAARDRLRVDNQITTCPLVVKQQREISR